MNQAGQYGMDMYQFESLKQGHPPQQGSFQPAGQIIGQGPEGPQGSQSTLQGQNNFKGGHIQPLGQLQMQTGQPPNPSMPPPHTMDPPFSASVEFPINVSQFRQADFDFDTSQFANTNFSEFMVPQSLHPPAQPQGHIQQQIHAPVHSDEVQQRQIQHPQVHQQTQLQTQQTPMPQLQAPVHTQQTQGFQQQAPYDYVNQFQMQNQYPYDNVVPEIPEDSRFQAPTFVRPPLHQSSFSYDSSMVSNTFNHNDHNPNNNPSINISYSYDNSLEIPPYVDNPPKRKPSTHIDSAKNKSSKSPTIIQSKINTTPKITLPKKSTKPKHSSKLRQGGNNGAENKDAIYNFGDFQKSTEGIQDDATKKSKKPEFFLPLDNLGGENAKLGPTGKLLPKFPEFSAFSDSSVATNYERMRILEPDLGLNFGGVGENRGGENQFYNFQDNVTPLMQPPGTGGEQGYFDFKGGDGNSPFVMNTTRAVSDGGSVQSHHGLNNGQSLDDSALNTYQDLDFHPDLVGFNFDDPNASGSASSLLLVPKDSNNNGVINDYEEGDSGDGFEKDTSNEQLNGNPNDLIVPGRPSMERSSSSNSLNSLGADKTKKKRFPKGSICQVCAKYISRDMTRHMRTHDKRGRFQCVYPKDMCNHKTGNFNRPYDYKKHLLHMHFLFDDPKGKTAHTLGDKLPLMGACKACKQRYNANDWLHKHILSSDERCVYIPENQ